MEKLLVSHLSQFFRPCHVTALLATHGVVVCHDDDAPAQFEADDMV